MPASLDTTLEGFLVFAAVKFAGYSLYAQSLNKSYPRRQPAALVGITRTGMGIAFGCVYYGIWELCSSGSIHGLAYWIGLLPVRFLEWWLLIRIFYDRPFQDTAKGRRHIVLGTACSYILDIPAWLGFVAFGMSIC